MIVRASQLFYPSSHTRLRQLGASRTGFYPSLNLRSTFAYPSLILRSSFAHRSVRVGGKNSEKKTLANSESLPKCVVLRVSKKFYFSLKQAY